MHTKELVEIGLTKNQAKAYLALIKEPGQNPGGLAKRLSIDRSFLYGILNSLIDKGLVSYATKENKRVYYASDPENLLKEIEEKKRKTFEVVRKLKTIEQETKEKRQVRVYEGKSGLKAYVRDILDSTHIDILGGGGKLEVLETLKSDFPHFLRQLKKKKIKGRLLTSTKNKKKMKELYQNSKVSIKTLEGLKSEVNFAIFKKKIAIYVAEEKPFVVIIEDKKIADALKKYFDILWDGAKK